MTQEEVDEKIDQWHQLDIQIPVFVWLNWTIDQYKAYIERGIIPGAPTSGSL